MSDQIKYCPECDAIIGKFGDCVCSTPSTKQCEHGIARFWCNRCGPLMGIPVPEDFEPKPASAPREWWIVDGGDSFTDEAFEFLQQGKDEDPNGVHVIEKSAYLEVVKERDTAQRDFDVANERIRHLGYDLTGLREQVAELTEERDTVVAKHEELLSYLPKAPTQPYEKELAQQVSRLERELAEAKTNVKTINDVCNENFLKLQTENARLLERYKHIEISNKEMTKNDHVTFGKLLTENAEAKESSLSIIKKLRAELDSKANENAELLEEIGRDTTKIGDLLHKVKMLDNKVANLDGDLEQSEYSLTAARAEVERYKSDWLYERDKRLRYGVALEWIAGKTDKPYCTYYERILPDGIEVPTYFDIAEKALKEST